jgi:hypothetical protein
MSRHEDDKDRRQKPETESRQARLEQALRANLLKRKEQARARKGSKAPSKEGGQERG